jgi:exodeoxyribonuclease V alpha subunit
VSSIKAYIENIIYYNEDNYYAVLEASAGSSLITLVGHFPYISAGESIEAEGEYTSHPVYGEQFSVSSFQVTAPEGADAIERYLAGGAIRGIGPALAKRIVKKFKADTFRIIEEEPERLAEVKGISEHMAMLISEQAQLKRGMREAVMYMQQFGIGSGLANRIYEKYGPALYAILNSNPYRLAEDMDGIGFRTADRIAIRMGIEADSEFRIRCGLLYVLTLAALDGHTWLPKKMLKKRTEELLDLGIPDLDRFLMDLQIDGRIIILEQRQDLTEDTGRRTPENVETQVYLAAYYYTERNIADRLYSLAVRGESDAAFVDKRIKKIEKETGIELDDMQREAVRASVNNGLLILTGGPGTGKTTTINTLIRYYAEDHDEIMLAAPTGRAAKRMTEATGQEAKTIHRMLEYTGVPEQGNAPGSTSAYEGTRQGLDGEAAPYAGAGNAGGAGATSGKGRFMRDEKDPLEADVLIIDEMSMVDIFLMDALLKAVVPGTRVILVGDANQLPSVGAGNVLRDLIDTGCFETVSLTHIFRQAAQSDIVLNAHRINNGEAVDLGRRSDDFLFIRSAKPEGIISAVKTLITDKLPPYVGCDRLDIQVLCATRKGALGVESLNRELQQYLNPPSRDKAEHKSGETVLREEDKVMQVKNDYDLEWTRYDDRGLPMEHGSGVFNGDIGRIGKIDELSDTVTVIYDENRYVEYDRKQLLNLELAYAVTVHKSQGSEYPAVVMPMYRGPHLLMNRNLLYTAVTRARKCVCMVGLPQVFEEMERNESESKRYTGLRERIMERYSVSAEMSGL